MQHESASSHDFRDYFSQHQPSPARRRVRSPPKLVGPDEPGHVRGTCQPVRVDLTFRDLSFGTDAVDLKASTDSTLPFITWKLGFPDHWKHEWLLAYDMGMTCWVRLMI
jgi:hypothetical protein